MCIQSATLLYASSSSNRLCCTSCQSDFSCTPQLSFPIRDQTSPGRRLPTSVVVSVRSSVLLGLGLGCTCRYGVCQMHASSFQLIPMFWHRARSRLWTILEVERVISPLCAVSHLLTLQPPTSLSRRGGIPVTCWASCHGESCCLLLSVTL